MASVTIEINEAYIIQDDVRQKESVLLRYINGQMTIYGSLVVKMLIMWVEGL